MSKSLGLCKFNNGNIYYCLYNGTVDIMNPTLFSKDDLNNESYGVFTKEQNWEGYSGITHEDVKNAEEVELYADYGSGFHWMATACENKKLIFTGLMPFDEGLDYKKGKPEWVIRFLNKGL